MKILPKKIYCNLQKTIIPFSTNVLATWSTKEGYTISELKNKITSQIPKGSTNIYETSVEAIELLNKEHLDKYNVSIVLMTDGQSNMGSFSNLSSYYKIVNKQIPIYSIMFGDAYEYELQDIADLTNGKIFDGKTDLLKAFKEVRGYN